jgi:hypothetical protein
LKSLKICKPSEKTTDSKINYGISDKTKDEVPIGESTGDKDKSDARKQMEERLSNRVSNNTENDYARKGQGILKCATGAQESKQFIKRKMMGYKKF